MNFRRFSSVLALAFCPVLAQASVSTMPRFVAPGNFALGIEPEIVLTNGAGVGVTARYTHGINDLMNVIGTVGTGTGPRKFRLGATTTFDFFPDIEGQPGIGLGFSGIYYRLAETGQFEVTATPYLHKTFVTGTNEVEPYFGIPVGMGFSEGRYRALTSLAVGAMFKSTPAQIRYNIEFGIAVNNTDSYISAGLTWYP